MAKRAAASAPASAPTSKKVKPTSEGAAAAPASKSKGKKAAADASTDSPLQAVKQVASDLINTVSEVVDNAGDLILDDGNTPAPVSKVIEENVDVPALKKKGKTVKGKAVEAAKDAEAAVENVVEEKTGVDVKAAKGKASKAAKAAKEQAEAAVEAVQPAVDAAKPLKGKAAKAAAAAQEKATEAAKEVEKAAKDPKNRKKAEDFMTQAEETVKKVAGDVVDKVGEVLGSVVDKFGEASGLTADLGTEVAKGKKQAQKKGKQAKEAAEDALEEGKKQVGKKGKQVQETAEEVVEEGKKQAGKQGKQAKDVAEVVLEEGKKQAGKKGKAAAETAEEVKETTKRKAKNVAAAAEPATKKAKAAVDAAEPAVTRGKKAAEPVVEKGKKAAATATKATKAAATKAAKAVEAVVEDEDQEMGEDDDEEGSYIHGFSSSDGEADSSDDESDAEDLAVAEAGRKIDMSSLPMVAKDDKSVQARLKKAAKKKGEPKGTIFLGRIPHGFYEEQMKEYFSQFGDVSRLRLARNRKTGASKHYAYIEFSSQSVAEIVADTMNNYLLSGHILKCQALAEDEVHPQLWVGANKKFRPVPRARVEKQKHEKERTDEQKAKADKNLKKKESQRKKKIEKAGIDYQFEGH
ncbi:hypothetical protein I317_02905 [Kwoniella heveanensis CBS 569]|nr:hypothetical protein I317_02905 [Kwoniella heveanensis CBS 569]